MAPVYKTISRVSWAVCLLTAVFLHSPASSLPESVSQKLPFNLGERFVYDVTWLGILGGEATLSLKNKLTSGESNIYSINLIARSIGWVRSLYRVEDHSVSYFDMDHLRSQGVDIQIAEGNYRKHKVIEFDHKKGVARYSVDEEQPKEYKIDPNTVDSFSVLYAFRAQRDKIRNGEPVVISIFDDRKKYEMKISVLRKERITTKHGLVDTIVVEPMLKSEGIFQRRGKMTIWFSDDKAFAPVMVQSKIMVGSFIATLREYSDADINFIPIPDSEKDGEKKSGGAAASENKPKSGEGLAR